MIISGAVFTIILGCVFHFIYSWLNKNKYLAYFVSVNESTWEHIKLVILPSLLCLIIDYHHFFNNYNLFFAKFIGIISSILIMLIMFYGCKIISKKSNLVYDISTYFISIIFGQYIFTLILFNKTIELFLHHIGLIGIVSLLIINMIFTFTPIKNILFKDPKNNNYGLSS